MVRFSVWTDASSNAMTRLMPLPSGNQTLRQPPGSAPAAKRVRPSWLPIAALCLAATSCFSYPPDRVATGQIGGRVLLAPGVGLEAAKVTVTQVNLYDGMGDVRKTVGESKTDADGNFPAIATGITSGLMLLETQGGAYTDPVNGARIQLDPSVHFRAIHWLGLFEDRSTTAWITPVHAVVEARFRYQVGILHDTFKAADAAYAESNRQFGGLDWEKIIPADLTQPATSPTDAIRASFLLGGLALLSDDIRLASQSSPQVVGLTTLVAAMAADATDGRLDGNDNNNAALGSGLQVGECPAVDARCAVPETGCALGACRTLCDLYANTYRTQLSDSISKFIGPRAQPSPLNKTGLGSEDARNLVDSVAKNTDVDLFGDACVDTQHRAPPSIFWLEAPKEGEPVHGLLTLQVRAVDSEGTRAPIITFDGGFTDTDGHPDNDVATVSIDTMAATSHADGPLTVSVTATGAAGNQATASRTFVVDNTAPSVTLDSSGLLVSNGVWWTATQGAMVRGMATDMHGVTTIRAKVGDQESVGVVTGSEWSVQLPPLPSGRTADVTFAAVDAVGNQATKTQAIELDDTPPSLTVDKSEVVDELTSMFRVQVDATTGAKTMVHQSATTRVDLAAGVPGACPTIRKHLQLLYAPKPDRITHGVLGSAGDLNALTFNVVPSDDGVGIDASSVQYRVLLTSGGTPSEIWPWTNVPQVGAHYAAALYVDAIPQLGTTNGEFHVELRVQDKFGRQTTQERCWNHVVMAPPLQETSPSGGEKAQGFSKALWSKRLNPQSNEFGDFAQSFLTNEPTDPKDPNYKPPTELAIWRERIQNYLGLPVYVKVEIPGQHFSATVNREFRVRQVFTNTTNVHQSCGTSPCVIATLPQSDIYKSDFNATMTQTDLEIQARLFVMSGNELGAIATDCPAPNNNQPCVVAADKATHTYIFQIPARTGIVTDVPPEYGIATTLSPKLPSGGTSVLMAPSDDHSGASGPFQEFNLLGATLTGQIDSTIAFQVCTDQVDQGEQQAKWFCTLKRDIVQYRALSNIAYNFNDDLNMIYSSAALPSLFFAPLGSSSIGKLRSLDARIATAESALP